MLKRTLLSLSLLSSLLFLSPVAYAGAEPLKPCAKDSGNENTTLCTTSVQDLTGGILKNVINALLLIAGVIAVIMVIVGGIRYITSDGDSNKANQAKNTILYAVIGIVVAVMSYSIVNFVIGRL